MVDWATQLGGLFTIMESPVKTTRIYEKVVEKLKEEIADGRLLPGDPLPSERQLMETFGVSRSSLREAFRVMELLGPYRVDSGQGALRAPAARDDRRPEARHPARRLPPFSNLWRRGAYSTPPSPARARCARRRRTSCGCCASSLRRRSTLALPRDRAQADFDFHLVLAEATHNFVFVNITRMNFDLILATHERIYNLLDDKGAFLNEHREMYDAILDHDAERAREAASRHIDRIYRTLHKGIAAGI